MKYGLQLVPAWSHRHSVENVSKFLLESALEAEDSGWDGFFLWDHLFFTWAPVPIPDSWSVISAIAVKTNTIKLGTNVTPVTRRRPQVLAKQLVTIDQISDGRVILGAGLGGSGQDNSAGEEFTAFNEPSNYKCLAKIADEALDVVEGLWSGKPFSYNGEFYKVSNVTFQPTPIQKPRIPIWIGAIKEPALRRAAKYDGWITGGPCPSVGDPGLSFKEVADKINQINKYRQPGSKYDVVYAFEFQDDNNENFIRNAEEINVTWLLDIVSAIRFSKRSEALKYIRKGPLQ